MELLDLNKLFLINETLVEKLLNKFTDDFRLSRDFKDLESLKLYFINLAARDNILLKFEEDKNSNAETVSGKFLPLPHEIIIYLPKNFTFTAYDVFNVFFHEYVHYINEISVKQIGKLNPIRGTKLGETSYISAPSISFKQAHLHKNVDLEYQLIEYVIQPQERSNWAFSIAYDIYSIAPVILKKTMNNFNKPDQDLIDKLIKSHSYFWKEKHTEYQIEKYSESLGASGSQVFFFLLGIYIDLMSITHKDFIKNQDLLQARFDKLLDLIKKYYKRIIGVMLYAKQNKGKLSVYRVGD